MKKNFSQCEKSLQFAWKALKRGASFKSLSGRHIEIFSPGTWNFEEGPDFRSAKFTIDGLEMNGDIEIHLRTSDWEQHGHSSDPNYRSVKIHAVLENNWNNEKLREHGIDVILIGDLRQTSVKNVSEQKKFGGGACVKFFSLHDDASLHAFFIKAGIERLRKKSEGAATDMINDGADATLLRKLFESAGYKKNKDNFIELFNRCREHDEITSPELFEAVIWGESGLLPDPTVDSIAPEMKGFVSKVWGKWWKNRIEKRKKIKWIKNGIRPLNSPERRIAGLCGIVRKLGSVPMKNLIKTAQTASSPSAFTDFLISVSLYNDELWDKWTNFRDKRNVSASVIGEMRAVDIAVNVFLPCLHAHAEILKKQNMREFSENVFAAIPPTQDNIKIKMAANKWFMPPSRAKNIITDAASAQGVLHILKNFCERNLEDCNECRLKI